MPETVRPGARPGYRRARRPAEKAERQQAILAAAAALVDELGVLEVSLSAVAARAGLTKSNLYRYFESREEMLLELFRSDLAALAAELAPRLARARASGPAAAARALAQTFLARPRLCRFLGLLAGVLELNVSAAAVARIKRATLELLLPLGEALRARLPGLSLPDALWALHAAALLVAGFYPAAHPGAAAREVLAQPEFAALRLDPERDLSRAIAALLRGVLAERR